MPALQDVIHKIEEGEWTRYVKLGVALLGFLVLAVVYDIREFKNFSTPEAMDNAQLARNIARGEGYTTDFIRPLSLYLFQKQHRQSNQEGDALRALSGKHPDLANPPVYPLLLAGWMKVLPFNYEITKGTQFWRYQPEVMVAWLNQILFFIAVVLVFRLALRLFDAPVAWLSAILFAATDLYWRYSASGLSTMLLVVIFLLLVWCLVVMEQHSREETGTHRGLLALAALAGGLIAVGMLTRYSFGWLALPVIVYFAIFFGKRRAVLSLTLLAVCGTIVAPWLVRNYNLSGFPFGTATFAVFQEIPNFPQFRATKLERYMNGEFEVALGKVEGSHLAKKLMVNSAEIVRRDLLDLGGNWTSALFLIGLMVPFLNPGLNRLRVFLLLSLLVLIVVQALGKGHLSAEAREVSSENLLVIVAPLALIFGVAMFSLLLDQIELPFPSTRTLVTSGFALLVSAPLVFAMLPPRSFPVAYPPYWPPLVQDVAGWMEPDELMMSDMPWAVSWYGQRKCLWATLDAPSDLRLAKRSDFFEIHDYQKPIQGILLTRLTTDAKWFSQMIQSQDYAWGKFMLECLLRTNVPTGFPLKHSPPGFLQEGLLFLSDKNRWEPTALDRRKDPQP